MTRRVIVGQDGGFLRSLGRVAATATSRSERETPI